MLSSFLAPALNRRKDRWGGSLENRARLARQVARAVRDEVGDEVAVIAKTSLSDGFKGGLTTPDGIELAQMLEADRSEEHTSALQSLMRISYAVFCLKKKQKHTNTQAD